MDDQTISAYDAFASEFTKRYREGERIPIQRICDAFWGCRQLLEIGAGSGVDASRFIQAGFDYTGLEPSLGLIANSIQHFPELLGRIHHGALPLDATLCESWCSRFDAVFCSAVFMHIPAALRPRCMEHLTYVLRPTGKLFLTISENRDGLDESFRDTFGRLYIPLSEKEVIELAKATGLILLKQWDDPDEWQRRGLHWKSYLFEKSNSNQLK
jgi:hypothetical protein